MTLGILLYWVCTVPLHGLPLWLHLVWWNPMAPPTLAECGPETRWLQWVERMKMRRMKALKAAYLPSWSSSCWDPRCHFHLPQCQSPTGFRYTVSVTEITQTMRRPKSQSTWVSKRMGPNESLCTLVQGSLALVLRVSGLSQQRVDRLRMAVAAMWAASASWL